MTALDIKSLPTHRKPDEFDGGYLYVIGLSSGLVKVGRSQNPQARITSHSSNAAPHGVEITDLWLSPRHDNFKKNETRLIRLLGSAARGNEYFRIAFEDAVRAAKSLPFHRMSDEARSRARDESARQAAAFAKSMWGHLDGRPSANVPAEFPIGWAFSLLFAERLPGAISPRKSGDLSASVDLVVEATGLPREQILAWSCLDVVEHIATQAVRIQRLELEYQARLACRDDLTDRGFLGPKRSAL